MAENPYAAPKGEADESSASGPPGWGWKAYLAIFLWLIVGTYTLIGFEWMQSADEIDLAASLISLAGLAGYIFQRALGNEKFWRAWLPISVLWYVVYEFILSSLGLAAVFPDTEPLGAVEHVLTIAFVFPIYLGLYRYAYLSENLWEPPAKI